MAKTLSDLIPSSNAYAARVKCVIGDIADQDTDAIVTLIGQSLNYTGAINQSILAKAGEKLDEFVLEHIFRPRLGDVYAVPGFNLRCRHIFFGVVPNWRDDLDRDESDLLNVVRRAMDMTRSLCLKSVAFPPLGTGRHGFPPPRAARVLLRGIHERMTESIAEVRIVCPDEATMKIYTDKKAGG